MKRNAEWYPYRFMNLFGVGKWSFVSSDDPFHIEADYLFGYPALYFDNMYEFLADVIETALS